MTKSVILSLLVSVFLLPCIPALGQEIKMSVTVEAVPDAATKESFRFSGTITGSTLYPKGHLNVSNDVAVMLEYIEPGGKFRTLPTSMNVRYGQRKGKKYLTPEEKSGIKAKGISLFRTGLSAENEGKAIKFDKVLKVPQGAAAYRVVAVLTHQWSGTWNTIVYKNDVQTLAIPSGISKIPEKDKVDLTVVVNAQGWSKIKPIKFQLGLAWQVVESCDDQKWIGTWTRRPGTKIFDATWKKVSGEQTGQEVRDVIDFKGNKNGIVTLYRHGTGGTYTGKISPGGTNIRDGDASWYNGRCNWTARIKKRRRPFQYQPSVDIGAPTNREGTGSR